MKKRLLLFLLPALSVGESLHARRREDYRDFGAPPTDYVHLKTLSVAGHPFPGGFNANTVSYSLTVPFSTSSINISAEANIYPGVTVTGAGKTLPVGDNTFTATVPVSVKNITLHARANHSAAFVTGHTGIQSLRPGRNIFHITVTSEDGAVKTYPVVVHVVSNVII